jgi:hypothetical protein
MSLDNPAGRFGSLKYMSFAITSDTPTKDEMATTIIKLIKSLLCFISAPSPIGCS